LQEAKENGFEKRLFETVLHQLEFNAKKTKDHKGLGYLSHMVPLCLHGGDPVSFFKIDEYSKKVRAEFDKGNLFEDLISRYFLENEHKLRLFCLPKSPEEIEKDERAESSKLNALSAALTQQEKESIVQETYQLKEYQEKPQDQSVLPTLSIRDIERQIEFVDFDKSFILNKVKCSWFQQPTNGITYVRIKANLKNLPERHRMFVPMFRELLANIGTKNYRYDAFNDKLLNCTNGLEVSVDKYAYSEDHTDVHDRNEQLLLQVGFLDRNVDEAFECLAEILSTPNFDEPDNISDLIRMESVNKA